MKKIFNQRLSEILLIGSLIFCYAIFLFQPISLTTTDLGRHLANGREILAGNTQVLFKNVFSYTMPNNDFINHHWLSGVIFFLLTSLNQKYGFETLQLFFILVSVATLLFYYLGLRQISSWKIAALALLPFIFAFGFRTEIRPESFGYFFIAIYLLIAIKILNGFTLSKSLTATLIILQIFWVNLHISFIFGPIIFLLLTMATYLEKNWLKHKLNKLGTNVFALSAITFFSSIINPNHIYGLLQPFAIFHNYGYDVVENKDLIFLLTKFNLSSAAIFLGYIFLIIFFVFLYSKKSRLFYLFLALMGVLLGLFALRNSTIMMLFCGPFLTCSMQNLVSDLKNKIHLSWQENQTTLFLGIMIFAVSFFVGSGNLKPGVSLSTVRLGLVANQTNGADYFIQNNLVGPIFNDFDIGSYLVFYLYPKEKVFVDNRPEAFSEDFFQKTYIPMQNEEKAWQEQLQKYNFQVIFFRTGDYTPWAQKFLANRLNDPEWQVVQHNEQTIIFKRKN